MTASLQGPDAGHQASDPEAQASAVEAAGAPLEQEHHYVLPMGGPPIRCLVPLPLATRDQGSLQRDLPSLPGIPRASWLARRLALYCLSPGGVEFNVDHGRGVGATHDPRTAAVHERLRSNALRLPRDAAELVRFRVAIGLSDLPVRVGPCWAGGGSIHDSPWVHPPAEQLPALLEDWFGFMWSTRHPWSLRFALGIPQFLRIHPFAAGNGKTLRASLLKHAQTSGEIDPVALALMLMLQGRRESLLALWNGYYRGQAGEYLRTVSLLAGWLSSTFRNEQSAWADVQSPGQVADQRVDELLTRFFAFADSTSPRG